MGRGTWATSEQTEWLTERKKGFTNAQAAGTTRAFFTSTMEAFIKKWPIGDPSADDLAECDGNRDSAIRQNLGKLKDRLSWWFRNRTRANASGGRGKGGLLPIGSTQRRPLLPYQAYMRLHSDRIMPLIQAQYETYKLTMEEEGRKGLWAFTIDEARRMLDKEPDEVKSAVEEYRKVTFQDAAPVAIEPHALLDKGLAEAQKVLRSVQTNINNLSRTGENTLKKVEELTGFKGIMLIGGPHPETGRLVTLAIQNGRTLTLGNVFSHACEHWPLVQTSFEQFIASCFPPEVPSQVKAIYRGQNPFAAGGSAGVGETGNGTATALGPALSTPPSVTAPPVDAPPTHAPIAATSSANPPPPTTSTSSNAAPTRREKSYDELRSEQIAKNRILLARFMGGETYQQYKAAEQGDNDEGDEGDEVDEDHEDEAGGEGEVGEGEVGEGEVGEGEVGEAVKDSQAAAEQDVEMGGVKDLATALDVPDWAKTGRVYFKHVSTSEFWVQLVDAWWTLEQSLGFQAGQLHAKNRPEEIGIWIKYGRKASPVIKSLPNYVTAWRKWWARLQPACRRSQDSAWPLLQTAPHNIDEWETVQKSGANGVFMIVMSLAWWVKAVGADPVEVVDAAHDVTWAFSVMAGVQQ